MKWGLKMKNNINPEAEKLREEGLKFIEKEDYGQAEICFKKAIDIDSDYAVVYCDLGDLYSIIDNDEEIINYYNKAIELQGDYSGAYFNRAIYYSESNQYSKAISDYEKVLQLGDRESDAYYNLGNIYMEQDQYSEALDYFNKAIKIEDQDSEIYTNRGICYIHMEEYQKALLDLDMGLELDQNNYVAKYYRNKNIALFKSKGCKSNLKNELNIKVEDFEVENSISSAECEVQALVWDNYFPITLEIDLKDEDKFDNDKLQDYIKEFKQHILWLENNKEAVCKALIEKDMIELAEEWVESGDEAIIDGKVVYVDGDDIVELPITEEQFCKSVYFNSMRISIDEDSKNRVDMNLFLDTNPDYFATHSIDLSIRDGYKISVLGLVG